MIYVYELRNSRGEVEYVGETRRPKRRPIEHLKYNKKSPFLGRTDLTFNIVATFNDRRQALKLEGELKLSYGLEWTENNWVINNGRDTPNVSRKFNNEQVIEIRSKYAKGYQLKQLAQEYGVYPGTIKAMVIRATYKDV
jgi:predicted GIY-YIG superfamily endonuclease|tara:strand:- start:236 stop:652 length:417 start_codon:yes stop_codon:yes gene_type:complete